MRFLSLSAAIILTLVFAATLSAQTLEEDLQRTPAAELAAMAKKEGDAVRGAIVFFQPYMACGKCHTAGGEKPSPLGPDLTTIAKDTSDAALVEAVLLPSKTIRKGFEGVSVLTTDGKTLSAILVERTKEKLVLRDVARGGELITIPAADIDEVKALGISLMPAGQVNQLHSRQQFLDLVRYLIEVRDGGAARAKELQPSAALLTFTVPEYEAHLDHAGFIKSWNGDALKRGEAIYNRVCANCHGTKDKPGSLPTSLRFAEGKFKNGSDPLSMYRTLTTGFGLMTPQTWMVPSQKYDVIHYVREAYLKPHNPSQFVAVDAAYVSKLPKGDTRGPEPSKIEPWSAMDYGPSLAHTLEVPGQSHNIAYKGLAVRLDPGIGGVSRGRHWMLFDTDTLRVAAAWNGTGEAGENFIDWQGIQFNGAHGIHPRIVGKTVYANGTGPGWANAKGEFADDQRVVGRDGKRYGPLPRDWAKFKGRYDYGQQTVLSYSVGTTDILESPGLLARETLAASSLFLRTFNIGPRERDLVLQVAQHPDAAAQPTAVKGSDGALVVYGTVPGNAPEMPAIPIVFDGNTYLEAAGKALDLNDQDFTVAARIKTNKDGTIWAMTGPGPKWIPDGQTFFVRGGKLGFDIGWVGAVTAKTKVADNKWHDVAVTWEKSSEQLRLYVDGKLDGEGKLAAKAALAKRVMRIGFTSPDFPGQPYFQGEIGEVRVYQRRLTEGLRDFAKPDAKDKTLIARWLPSEAKGAKVEDASSHKYHAEVRRGASGGAKLGPLLAGFSPRSTPAKWSTQGGALRLTIPAGKEPLRFSVWLPADASAALQDGVQKLATKFTDASIPNADRDLSALTQGGPPRWPQKLPSPVVIGENKGPFAVDILTAPESNPWLAQTRFSGLDFVRDGRLAVCTWDGDVWIVDAKAQPAVWQRIATGLFQPLGLKIVDEKIHVTCRDQLAVLHDLNNDGEIDFYQCLNNDHQVTEHFHEFAMGLQTDADGNFYYAKSGQHGLAAIVPHHGTLLKVSKDGAKTDILATGFRAANGVCLNPDGSFVVTDQEGFWNPKNRINWVTVDPSGKPKFYGNMLGYHDVTDTSDAAMVPPLCWITNAFDRSPAELLWVESKKWGPLNGSLLNLSYGYGKVYVVPHEKVGGLMQGGMIELPIPSFPTGVMRGRFHPGDGHLYLCGMFAWGSSTSQPGGLYRLRATGQAMHLPVKLNATKAGLKLTFTEPLDPASIDAKHIKIKTWSLKRTAGYGSAHHDEKSLEVAGTSLSADGKTLTLDVADLRPTWGMEIKYDLRGKDGAPVLGTIHNTIHNLSE